MPRYFFDLREGDESVPDEEGLELSSIERVQEEAARSLADFARDAARRVTQDGKAHQMTIEVRDDNGPLMQVRFTIDVSRLRH
jgi:uncharacterized protein DUF6894